MAKVIALSAGVTPDDLDNAPFSDRGGLDGAIRDQADSSMQAMAFLTVVSRRTVIDTCAPAERAAAMVGRPRAPGPALAR